jgi:mobilome CxxCx(11)CxxC protein
MIFVNSCGIFEKRANKYRWFLRILSFLGILIPIFIGTIYLSFRTQQWLLDLSVIIAGILGSLQVLLSAWSLTTRWEDTYSYALESQGHNYRLSASFEYLGKYSVLRPSELRKEFDLLQAENRQRTEQDNKQGLTDQEKRMGMRAALRKFQRSCAGCKEVPLSMKPSKCTVCGNF